MNDASENLAGLVAVRPIVCEQGRSFGALPERKNRDQTIAETNFGSVSPLAASQSVASCACSWPPSLLLHQHPSTFDSISGKELPTDLFSSFLRSPS